MRTKRQKKQGAVGTNHNGRGASLVPTAAEVFSDGILEIVQNANNETLQLLSWDGTNATIGDQYEKAGRIYVPASLDRSHLSAMRFPTRMAQVEKTRTLFDDTCARFHRYLELPAASVQIIACFLLSDWMYDRLPIAPCLAVAAAHGAPVDLLLQLLGVVCRRPIVLSAITPGGIFGLPMNFRPTLLLDELGINRGIERVLRATNRPGIFVAKGTRALDLFCAKVVCTREYLSDDALGGLPLRISLPPVRQASLLDGITLNKIADEFQARFLSYRLQNLCAVQVPNPHLGQPTAETQGIAQVLASCAADDKELQASINALLIDQDKYRQVDTGLQDIVIESLLVVCHEPDRSTILSSEVAEIANGILAGRKEPTRVSREQVGWRLRSLGFKAETIGNRGRGIHLLGNTRTRIHQLALTASVRSIQSGPFPGCRHCSVSDHGTPIDGTLRSHDLH